MNKGLFMQTILALPFAILLFVLSFSLTFKNTKTVPTQTSNYNNYSEESFTQSSKIADIKNTYCTGIRGNGELAPAHWASLAKIIEMENAAPAGGSGGSSGSITMFILENFYNSPLIYRNKTVPKYSMDRDGLLKRVNAIDPIKLSFLFKFLPRYFTKIGELKASEYSQFLTLQKLLHKLKSDIKFQNALSEVPENLLSNSADLNNDVALNQLKPLLAAITEITNIITESGQQVRFLKLYSQARQANTDSSYLLDDYYLQWDGEIKKLLSAAVTPQSFQKYIKNNAESAKSLQLFIQNFRESLAVAGKFDVENDHNLFFRPGFIDFEKLGVVFNGILSFFNHPRLYNQAKAGTWERQMHSFFETCSKAAQGHSWLAKGQKNYDECSRSFDEIITTYYENGIWESNNNTLINKDVGQKIAAVVTTSVITGKSYEKTIKLRNEFLTNRDSIKQDIENYSVDYDDLFFGYWYNREYGRLEQNIKANHDDEKSKRFMDLGSTAWSKVFATSPAEPGLTNFRPFTSSTQENVISSGGWSDLHPTIVLKELKDQKGEKICDKVIYVTRRGGSSTFGQKVILKLLGLKDKLLINKPANNCKYENDKHQTTYDQLIKGANKDEGLRLFNWIELVNNNKNQCLKLSKKLLDSKWARLGHDVVAGEAEALFKDSYDNAWLRSKEEKSRPDVMGCW